MDSDKEGVKKGINICDTTGAKCFVVVFIFGLRNPMLGAGNYCSVVDDL
jgi:hypothetical protein